MNGFTKVTMYALTPILKQTVRKGVTKDKLKYINMVNYDDSMSGSTEKLCAIASLGQICDEPVFKSVKEIIAPNLLRAHPEECFAVSLQEHKIGIIIKNFDHEATVLLQVELNSARAKKKPLNMADVNQLKLLMLVMYERLQKFIIQTQVGTGKQGLEGIIAFMMKTARYESHKVLCRSLE